MERVQSTDPQRIVEYIRDAFVELSLIKGQSINTQKQNIIDGVKEYNLPSEAIAIRAVSVMDTENATELMEDNDRTMAAASNWTDTDMATYDETDDLSVTNDAADQSCYLNDTDLLTVGQRYRFTYDCTLTSGTFELQTYTSSTKLGDFADGTSNVMEFTAPETGAVKIVGTAATGEADFDNFSLMERSKDKYRRAARIIGSLDEHWQDSETN